MTVTASCRNASGLPKKAYASEEAARRDLKRSARWKRRATWPRAYFCQGCHAFHVGHVAWP